MSLVTSGNLRPNEIVEELLDVDPPGFRNQPFGPLVLLVKAPLSNEQDTFLEELEKAVLRESVPRTTLSGALSTSELPTLQFNDLDGIEADQIELLSELTQQPHCIVPLRSTSQKKVLSVGRSSLSDLVLFDQSVSGEHAQIYIEDDSVRLADQASKNGTFLNTQRLQTGERAWLQPMDRLEFGRVQAFACDPRALRGVLRQDLRKIF
ncbi:MAG: FHA domain-containing protein [Polyangiaceae bacterium]|nr:FHA domain-containing protein [Polyangiaceae bacterium]